MQTETTIFISYDNKDLKIAAKLYFALENGGVKPWMMEFDLNAGENIQLKPGMAIKDCDFFVPIFTKNSASNGGRVQGELKDALEVFKEKPEWEVFIIPLRMEDVDPGHSKLVHIQSVDMFPDWNSGIEKILKSIKIAQEELKKREQNKKNVEKVKDDNSGPIIDNNGPLGKEIRSYLQKAESLHGHLPVAGFVTQLKVPIDIEDIYIPLQAMVDLRGFEGELFCESLHAEKCLKREEAGLEISLPQGFVEAEKRDKKGIVILGDPGSGKTTHLKRLLLWLIRRSPEEIGLPVGMIPVFLPLHTLTKLDKGLDEFIQDRLNDPHLQNFTGFGERLLERGNLLFLLDGLDEVADIKRREEIARWITQAVKCHPKCRFVVTCRFAGYSPTVHLSEDFLEMSIRPLTKDQAGDFVKRWYKIVEKGLARDQEQAEGIALEKADALIKRLREPDFRSMRVFELTRNPLLLSNICLVHRHRGGLPRKRARLYEECIDVLLEHWREAKGLRVDISARSGRRALQPVALWLHREENRTKAKAEELAPHIEPVLKVIKWKKGDGKAFLKTIRDESGLITGWDQENYGFMHLGFQEYLAAREIRSRAFEDRGVLKELAGKFGDSWWREVGLLMLALEDPSLFEPYMREVLKNPAILKHRDLIDACLDDAAEVSPKPFMEFVESAPGDDSVFWERQFLALRILDRLDDGAVQEVAGKLRTHPSKAVRKWIVESGRWDDDVTRARKGDYELVRIPGGVFMMGSPKSEKGRYDWEGPVHEVSLEDFYMGRYPVTNEDYTLFLEENPEEQEPKFWADSKYNRPRQPVVGVSWYDAKRYAEWAGLSLPSESQWEYACRAGTTTPYHSGDSEDALKRVGWYDGNAGSKLHAVGEKAPNEFGLFDMHGNVWEWVEDDWHGDYTGSPKNASAWLENPRGSGRVLRGGSWADLAGNCRSAYRYRGVPDVRAQRCGFRLVLPPPGQ